MEGRGWWRKRGRHIGITTDKNDEQSNPPKLQDRRTKTTNTGVEV